jgi:hypothetical protein
MAMRQLFLIVLIMVFSLAGQSCKQSQEESASKGEEKVAEKAAEPPKNPQAKYVNRMKVDSKDASLKLAVGDKNVHSITLENSIPIRGVQFVLEGVEITGVNTTERTKGYLANFNAESGGVIMVHTSGGKIEAGKGSIAEIVCVEKGSPTLSDIKLAK